MKAILICVISRGIQIKYRFIRQIQPYLYKKRFQKNLLCLQRSPVAYNSPLGIGSGGLSPNYRSYSLVYPFNTIRIYSDCYEQLDT